MQTLTLMLDQGYRPVKTITAHRAIQMLTLGKVEVIEEYNAEFRSTYLVVKVPAVVRLLRAFKRVIKPVKFSRVNIYGRDDYRCQYCGERGSMDELTYDHVVPRSQGGKTTWANIVTACEDCNSRKAARTPAQAGMRLLKQPVQPTSTPAILLEVSRTSVPDAWRDYLYWTGALDEG